MLEFKHMNELKIGHLLFNKKSIQLILLGFFINGVILGGFIVASTLGNLENSAINIFWLMALLFISWLPLKKPIKENVSELS